MNVIASISQADSQAKLRAFAPQFPAPSTRGTLLTLVSVYVAGVLLLIAMLAWIDWNQRIDGATRDSGRIASLLAERAQRTIIATDRILTGVADRAARVGTADMIRQEDELELFRANASALPGLGSLWLFDAQGALLMTTSSSAPAPAPVPWQGALAGTGQRGIHLAGISKSRTDGRLVWPISKTIVDGSGKHFGTVAATILVDSFANLYEVADLGERSTLTLIHENGQVLMRQPALDSIVGYQVRNPTLLNLSSQDIAHVRAPARSDNVTRQYAMRRLEASPVVAVVGVALDDIRQDWMNFIQLLLGGAVIGILPVALFGALALRSARGEAEAGHALAQANVILEERVRTRTEELQAALRQAQIANAAKGRFIEAANRDLRQPLQSVRLFIDLLGIKLADGPHETTIHHARQALDQSEAVLVSLREIARLDAGMVTPLHETVPLADFLAKIAERVSLPETVSLRVHASGRTVRTDPVLLGTAVEQLLANAVKYTDNGTVLLAARCRSDRTVIEVWDTGCGIPEQNIPAIFEDFVQLRSDRAESPSPGLGLGLSLARRIVDLLGCTLDVRSRPGAGSVFRITLPAAA